MAGSIGHAFTGVIPCIGMSVSHMLIPDYSHNYRHVPLYVIGGSEDGACPKHCRRLVKLLGEREAPTFYVEYQNRGHEQFSEEYDAMMDWFFRLPAHRGDRLERVFFRDIERRHHWLEAERFTRNPSKSGLTRRRSRSQVPWFTGTIDREKNAIDRRKRHKLLHLNNGWYCRLARPCACGSRANART